ncbi:hypothetical protein LU293_04620 [Moraxella nasovis]|uniref:hypothetical protein n=1 Tax=Moraxella nasovis TaxID=2904121 RepID=UPI001F60DEF5|nr:hypothetical protein [Moraxella nasovis]UNU74180.1 hypothetical protein LU293_04620 [Moraxella nasovis]
MNLSNQHYPTAKIIILYPLLGGVVGGVLSLPYFLFNLTVNTQDGYFLVIFEMIFLVLIFSFVVGLLPALLAGIMMVIFKIHVGNFKSYFKAFVIGFVAVVLAYLGLMLLTVLSGADWSDWSAKKEVTTLWFALLGGLSSVVLARLFVPKR